MGTDFYADLRHGKTAEEWFAEVMRPDWELTDVRQRPEYWRLKIDYLVTRGKTWSVDVKTWRVQECLTGSVCIEDCQSYPRDDGWIWTSRTDVVAFACPSAKKIGFLQLSDRLREHYRTIRDLYQLRMNKPSYRDGRSWQSAFRVVPLADFGRYADIVTY